MDPYNRIKALGKGTFGTVYLCERKHNHKKVVVKEIDTDLKPDQLKAAQLEVKILKSLANPNIIQYFDSFYKNNVFYIIMEYATHGNLHEYIKNAIPKPIEREVVLNFFCQILSGLHHIHSKKIIHRDLKCENIFLTGLRGNVVKIGDFGISTSLAVNDKANTFIGTTNYLAPEMCDGSPYDTKADIWSLGCILYEICALERMFDGPVARVVLSIKNGSRKLINLEKYGAEIQQLIDITLQDDPAQRPATVNLMAYAQLFPTIKKIELTLKY